MDEQLQQILEEADRRGYDSAKKQELVSWYLTSKKPATPNTTDYLSEKYSNAPKKIPGALEQLAVTAYSTVADQLPSGIHSATALEQSRLANSDEAFILSMRNPESEVAVTGMEGDYYANREGYFKKKLGDAEYNRQRELFRTQYKDKAIASQQSAKEESEEGERRTEGFTKTTKDVHNTGDAIRYGASAIGEALGSSLPAIATLGATAVLQEGGGAYDEAVAETAKALSTQYGEEWTPEAVIRLGYDKPAIELAQNVGLVNAALEQIGNVVVFGKGVIPFAKQAAKQIAKKGLVPALKKVGTGAGSEAITEFLQESTTQYAALKAAGHEDAEIFGTNGTPGIFDWERSTEAGIRGGVGGGGLSVIGSALSTAPEDSKQKASVNNVGDEKIAKQEFKLQEKRDKVEAKLSEKQGERQAILEEADAISNEAVQEDLNEGTEEDIDEFTASIKKLVDQKERDEEIAKLEKDQLKVEDEKEKIVTQAVKAQEKIDIKEAAEANKEIKKTESKEKAQKAVKLEVTNPEKVVEKQTKPKGEPKAEIAPKEPKKLKTEEGTINLETGDFKEKARKVGRKSRIPKAVQPELPIAPKEEPKVPEKQSPNPNIKSIEDEGVKFNKQFINRYKLPKPSQRNQRLQELRETIANSPNADYHKELISKVDKELDNLKAYISERSEARVKKEAKAKPKKEVTEEQKTKVAESDKKLESLQEQKKAITDKYGDLRSKTGQVLAKAVSQDKWDPADIARVREINRQIDEEAATKKKVSRTPEKEAEHQAYKDQGLDDDTASALIDPDEVVEIKPQDLDIQNMDIEDRLSSDWSELKEESVDSYVENLKNVNPIFKDIVESQMKVIRKAYAKDKFRVFSGKSPKNLLGEAVRDQNKSFIFLNTNFISTNYTKQHELNHIFEFAINQLEGGKDVWNTRSWKEINNIYESLLKRLNNLSPEEQKIMKILYPNGDSNIYGLSNAREMVAESMINYKFATLLAHLKTGGRSSVTYLEKLYNALTEFVNILLSKLNMPTIKSIGGTYLGDIINTFETTIDKLDMQGEIDASDFLDSARAAFEAEEPTYLTPQEKARKKTSKALSDKIFNQARKQGFSDIKAFKNYIKGIEASIGKKLGNGVKAGLVRRMNAHLKRLELVKQTPTIISDALKTEKGKFSPDYRFLISDFQKIDYKQLTPKEQDRYVDALLAIQGQVNKALSNIRPFIQEMAAKKAINEVLDPTTGVGFREFKRQMTERLVNLPTFIGHISKYSKEKGPVLMKYFHDLLGVAYKDTQIQVNDYVSHLNKIALANKLGVKNFQRIYYYGQLLVDNPAKPMTFEEKYQQEKFTIMTKLKAVKRGYENKLKVEDVEAEAEELDRIYNRFVNAEETLTQEELNYYKEIRNILDGQVDAVQDNSEIAWDEEFIPLQQYVPKVAIGSIPMPVQGDANNTQAPVTKSVSLKESDLLDIFSPNPQFQPLQTTESGFHFIRTGGKGVYYESNVHNVMARYLHSTVFNINASYQVQKLNKMFKGANRDRLDEELGQKNAERLLTFLKNGIKYARRASTDYDGLTKFLLAAKNRVQTAKIGTSGQFVTQYVAMLPATMALTGYSNTKDALKFMWNLKNDQNAQHDFNQLVSQYATQLAIRDFFFEKYETVEDIAKEGTAGQLKRFAEKSEKKTVTGVMSWSDRHATQLTFLSAFLEAGANMQDRSTWTPERIAKAELKTAQLQNVSSPLYAPEALRQDNAKSALFNAAMWSFKSFSLNSMMNFILATPDALKGNNEAQKLVASHAVSALAFETASTGVRGAYALVGLGIAQAFGYEPPERKDDQSLMDYVTGVLVNGFYSLFFGGLPSAADATWRYIIGSGVLDHVLPDGKNPLYSSKEPKEVPGKALGPYEAMWSIPLNTIEFTSDYLSGTKVTEDRFWEMTGKIVVEVIQLTPTIPFRGDISKLITSAQNKVKSTKRANKGRRRKSTRGNYY